MVRPYGSMAADVSRSLADCDEAAIPIRAVRRAAFLASPSAFVTPAQAAWLEAKGWKAEAGSHALLPGPSGIEGVVVVLDGVEPTLAAAMPLGALPAALPAATYRFDGLPVREEDAVAAWLLGAYTFERYRTEEQRKPCRLALPAGIGRQAAIEKAQAIWYARELIDTPANDLSPSDLAQALATVGEAFGAEVRVVSGEDLLDCNFPLIHAVGRASARPPCLADLVWGNPADPKVTLVGKGICFDSGGLDIKPPAAMALMKKDMGGAASVMALGAAIMAAKLPVRLRILVPAADNSISGSAFRPGDIIRSRAGITVEIANTDAEGRLVLADALALADEDAPDLLVDMATLTGAARVALGPELMPFYTDDEGLAADVTAAGLKVADPAWRMPLWAPYDEYLKSKVADVNHIYDSPFAGSIVAALFLKRFVKNAKRYAHFDIYAWTPRALPGKPQGGEPQGARTLFEVVENFYGRKRA